MSSFANYLCGKNELRKKERARGETRALRLTTEGADLHGLRAGDLQIIGDGENARYRVGAHISQLTIGLVADVANERHVTGIDDDVNRRIRPHRVAVETGVSEDGTIFGAPN